LYRARWERERDHVRLFCHGATVELIGVRRGGAKRERQVAVRHADPVFPDSAVWALEAEPVGWVSSPGVG
jgi:hypothetical protein